MNITVAKHASFCFGVDRAVKTVYEEIEKGGEVYTFGPIIHNETVVNELGSRGVRILKNEDELLELAEHVNKENPQTVIIRSHGTYEKIFHIIKNAGLNLVDATCPFVKKIHEIVRSESELGRTILIYGTPGHAETEGIKGWCGPSAYIVKDFEDIESLKLPYDIPLTIVSQTTMNVARYEEIVDKLKNMGYDINCFNTLCNATKERQEEAADLASKSEAMFVLGSYNSSNTNKLFEICKSKCKKTFLISSVKELEKVDLRFVANVGITAGASTPKTLIEEVQNYVRNKF